MDFLELCHKQKGLDLLLKDSNKKIDIVIDKVDEAFIELKVFL